MPIVIYAKKLPPETYFHENQNMHTQLDGFRKSRKNCEKVATLGVYISASRA